MREFRITLHHRAGELSRLTQAISHKSLNLKSVAGISEGNKAIICLVSEDVTGLRSLLQESRTPFEESELLTQILEDEPGQIANLTGQLAEAGVNLGSIYILARDAPLIEVGFTVDDPKKAKKALGI